MNQTQMLHQMCREVLSEPDVRAICKNRGLPAKAASSRQLLETLFLSDVGVAGAMRTLDQNEVALLHLLRLQDKPVDIAFFSRLDPSLSKAWSYGTFSQRFQGLFAIVKDRLVRRGIVIVALGAESESKTSKMERWQFALPAQFARQLPPLLESAKRLSGDGDWRTDAGRAHLKTAVAQGGNEQTKNDRVAIVGGELRWNGQPFRAERVEEWQKLQWHTETNPAKPLDKASPYLFLPADAVLAILATLDAGLWSDAETLAIPLEIFCGARLDAGSVCESGWRWGFLARQEAEGRMWYCLAPAAPTADIPPDRYLAVRVDEVYVDLDNVPYEALETLVRISEQRMFPTGPDLRGPPHLLLTPNLVKLGQMADAALAHPLIDWLEKNARTFHKALETVRERRGKTLLHENLAVAHVTDLSLKVALEKALGNRVVPLGEEYLAFPHDAVAEVRRLVTHLGHVVKEVAHHKP